MRSVAGCACAVGYSMSARTVVTSFGLSVTQYNQLSSYSASMRRHAPGHNAKPRTVPLLIGLKCAQSAPHPRCRRRGDAMQVHVDKHQPALVVRPCEPLHTTWHQHCMCHPRSSGQKLRHDKRNPSRTAVLPIIPTAYMPETRTKASLQRQLAARVSCIMTMSVARRTAARVCIVCRLSSVAS